MKHLFYGYIYCPAPFFVGAGGESVTPEQVAGILSLIAIVISVVSLILIIVLFFKFRDIEGKVRNVGESCRRNSNYRIQPPKEQNTGGQWSEQELKDFVCKRITTEMERLKKYCDGKYAAKSPKSNLYPSRETTANEEGSASSFNQPSDNGEPTGNQPDMAEQENAASDGKKESGSISPKEEHKPEPRYELFAQGTDSDMLVDVLSSFRTGHSIYKLRIYQDDRNAELTLCIDNDSVKERILGSSSDLLSASACNVERKSPKPEDVVVAEPGMAEKDGDTWRVVKQISVQLI